MTEPDPEPGGVWIDPELPAVPIPAPVLNEVCRHARDSFPEECCGLIAGDARGRFREAWPCHNEMTERHGRDPARYPRDNRRAYFMRPTDYQRIQADCEARGLQVTAVYHSHVDTAAYLSELDLESAGHRSFPFPGAAQLVVALHDRHAVPQIGLFERRGAGRAFVGRAVSSAQP